MTKSRAFRARPCQTRSYRSRMRPALTAKSGSRGKIQMRCRQGRSASALSQRHKVAPLISATNPWVITSRRNLGKRKSRQGQLQAMWEFTGESFNLDDDAGGKSGRVGRPEVAPRGQGAAR